jgi:hypothetical protein
MPGRTWVIAPDGNRWRRDGELRAQMRINARAMPIEDASVVWPEEESPYRTIARLTVPPQPAWSEARARQVDDGLTLNPWNRLADHRPLGSNTGPARRLSRAARRSVKARRGVVWTPRRGRWRRSESSAAPPAEKERAVTEDDLDAMRPEIDTIVGWFAPEGEDIPPL